MAKLGWKEANLQEHNRTQYQLLYPKCALTGRMIFPGEAFVQGEAGKVYVDPVARALDESGRLEIDSSDLGPSPAWSAVWLPAPARSSVDPDRNIIVNLA